MPLLSVWAIRASLIYLLLGFTFGQLMLVHKGLPFNPSLWRLLPAHIEFLLVGWMGQLALGVAHWIIPRFRGGDFGRPALARWSLVMLNAGVLMAGLAPLVSAPPAVRLLGRVLEAAAAMTFALYIWPRIRPLGH